MSSRLHEVERVYHEAAALGPAERAEFLDAACGGDISLRDEVVGLLALEAEASRFMEEPAIHQAAAELRRDQSLRLIGRRLNEFRVLSLLGSGGMCDVYKARDEDLGRFVALKLLADAAASPQESARFEEEARSASQLNHTNIVTVFRVGRVDDIAYIVMEYVEGATLRGVFDRGPMPIEQAIEMAAQLADGLAFAHAAGVVHRDLKPENVMMTSGGRIKILDFGIAKRYGVPDPSAGGRAATAPATNAGIILGTVGYMSPEQAAGRPADHRSDQFSLGVILFEAVTGRRAFLRDTRASTLSAIQHQQLDVDDAALRQAPAELRAVMQRCLAKDPAVRYDDTAALAAQLGSLRHRSVRLSRRRALALGSAAAVMALAGAVAWRRWPQPPAVHTLAVLPFQSAAADDDGASLSDALTEGVIRRLAQVVSLQVAPLSVVSHFGDATITPGNAGRQLRSDAVISGRLERRADEVVVTASLIAVATDEVLWRREFVAPAAAVVTLEEQVARAVIADGLQLRLPVAEERAVSASATQNATAYLLYSRALASHREATEEGYLAARDLLSRAVAIDPTFALAHVAMASTYSVMAIDGFEEPHGAWLRSIRGVEDALAIDPDLPSAHAERASSLFFYDRAWDRADRAFEFALRRPGAHVLPDLLVGRALVAWARRDPGGALALVRQARVVDPISVNFAVREADILASAARLEEAGTLYEETIAREPGDPRAYFGLAAVRQHQHRFDDAIAWRRRGYARSGRDDLSRADLRAAGAAGCDAYDRLQGQSDLAACDARARAGAYVSPLDVARAAALLGQRDRALSQLSAAFAQRAAGVVFLHVDPVWDGLRDTPAFRAAVDLLQL